MKSEKEEMEKFSNSPIIDNSKQNLHIQFADSFSHGSPDQSTHFRGSDYQSNQFKPLSSEYGKLKEMEIMKERSRSKSHESTSKA